MIYPVSLINNTKYICPYCGNNLYLYDHKGNNMHLQRLINSCKIRSTLNRLSYYTLKCNTCNKTFMFNFTYAEPRLVDISNDISYNSFVSKLTDRSINKLKIYNSKQGVDLNENVIF